MSCLWENTLHNRYAWDSSFHNTRILNTVWMPRLKPFRGPHHVKRSCFGHKIKIGQWGYNYRYFIANSFTWFFWPKTPFVDVPITFGSVVKQIIIRLERLPAIWLVAVPGSCLRDRPGDHTSHSPNLLAKTLHAQTDPAYLTARGPGNFGGLAYRTLSWRPY